MSKLTRYFQKIFGSTAGTNEISEYGSKAAGIPARYSGSTITPAIVQQLGEFDTGWKSATLGSYSPAMEDLNAVDYLWSYQFAYLFQQGIAEWQTDTVYYKGSVVQDASGTGFIYQSLTDNNSGNAVSSTANWKLLNSGFTTITASTYTATTWDDFIRADTTANAITITLPAVASVPIGKRYTVKNIGATGYYTFLVGSGSETIDGNNSYQTGLLQYDSVTVINTGTTWDVI